MRIVVAPNAFKGSLSALDAAEAIGEGIRAAAADADVVLVPIADGGDGTVEALVLSAHGERGTLRVRGPLGDPVDANYGLIDQGSTAVIEMAKAAGLALVPPQKRDPRVTTTYGVGELLQHAYDGGARHFIASKAERERPRNWLGSSRAPSCNVTYVQPCGSTSGTTCCRKSRTSSPSISGTERLNC